ncbi:hypothetical protein CISG_04334 [Coccidioides immitis RMSCC 3703]|uniref:Uncharacterized protein n=1 Tax=Coccidioides immitis RMSCC 3703 TaxID=454286 RepID=A0A0J8TMV7_COCIT|nr:hypothetical protein CISG_04334 [Coccidioides immitis RMSCC 3703]
MEQAAGADKAAGNPNGDKLVFEPPCPWHGSSSYLEGDGNRGASPPWALGGCGLQQNPARSPGLGFRKQHQEERPPSPARTPRENTLWPVDLRPSRAPTAEDLTTRPVSA